VAVTNAGTNYGASDDELAAVFDEVFDSQFNMDVYDDTYLFCWTTIICEVS
jgi:hypothetical protein